LKGPVVYDLDDESDNAIKPKVEEIDLSEKTDSSSSVQEISSSSASSQSGRPNEVILLDTSQQNVEEASNYFSEEEAESHKKRESLAEKIESVDEPEDEPVFV
jgi:hypothetical protein